MSTCPCSLGLVRRATAVAAAVALSVVILVALPHRLSAFANVPKKIHALQGIGCAAVSPIPHSLRTVVFSLNENSNGDSDGRIIGEPLSPIEKAQKALERHDVQSAEESLMTAVAEVNGAIMNHPKLLRCFEDLFRTKIRIAQENDNNHQGEVDSGAYAYDIARDRMGLASLLTDQSKYQEAADELELAVHSLSVLVSSSPPQTVVVSALDKASSLLFRTRAMVCDWSGYESSSQNLSKSTHRALSEGALPSVHPFEAMAWPFLSLKDATVIAHEYANRALSEANAAALATTTHTKANANATPKLSWTDLGERLPRKNVPFVRAVTDGRSSSKQQKQAVIRVGYLSPDFTGKHPLAFLMQDVFRFHDTSRFEIILYSLGGEPDGSPEVNKILQSGANSNEKARNWKTLEGSVENMAKTISDDKLDVLVDLCGYTGTSLVAQVMAFLRGMEPTDDDEEEKSQQSPKAIHVAYMGFPGSSGAPYIDYMIADEVVIPSKFRPFYTENILYMPHCYFVNSHWHIRKERNNINQNIERSLTTREHYGLPASPVFVFCCHSRPDKIDPSTFATWIRALKRTRDEGKAKGNPGMEKAVLWLLRSEGTPQMEANLRRVAFEILGSSSDEAEATALVFCDQAPRQEHLERLALADLFLDTPAYNAHTVGCDCLSAGVPMISLLLPWHHYENSSNSNTKTNDGNSDDSEPKVPTEKLASRVGASLLKNAGSSSMLSDALVVASMEEYEDRMVECARSSSCNNNTNSVTKATHSFVSLKQHLLDQFSTAPLWDTERWVRNLETGLATMVDLRTKESCETDIYVMDYSDIQTH
jgi:protein O-GlcNAc transferase